LKKLIEIQNASVRLDNTIVLEDIDWQIFKGESWILYGSNGSGKTTLINLLLGKLPNFKGRVYNHLSTKETIEYIGFEEHQKLIKQELMIAESSYFAGNLDFDKNKLSNLSTGESRKYLIKKAVEQNPALLILDEPYDGLDTESRKQLKIFIENCIQAGANIVLVSHRFEEFPDNISKFLILSNGRILKKYENIKSQAVIKRLIKKISKVNKSINNIEFIYENFEDYTGKYVIEMDKVNIRYGEKVIFKDFSWKVKNGENWVITGPNGSGKSTLTKLITGDIPQAYSNFIEILGKRLGDNTNLWELKKNLGIVSPELQLNYLSNSSVIDVIASGIFDSVGLYRNISAKETKKIIKLSEALDMAHLLERPFKLLSNGQRRIVLIARALIKPPKILILDEPTAGLDAINRLKIMQIIENITKTQTSVVMITHYSKEIPSGFKFLSL
jgi:molybdate transport system ATP-binding protein